MKNFNPNENFNFYLYFMVERMNIFWRRKNNEFPYSEDEIFKINKFTNVYRVLDRSSQYLIKNIVNLENNFDKRDLIWRIVLYKHFNLPSTWDYFKCNIGEISLNTPIDDINECLNNLMREGKPVYSNAYMITAFTKASKYGKINNLPKHTIYLKEIFKKEFIKSGLLDSLFLAKSFEDLFNVFKKLTNFGDFQSYQYAQDLNYTKIFNFDDNSFCSAGPGTKRGILRTFDIEGKPDYQEIVKWVHNNIIDLMKEFGNLFDIDYLDLFKPIPGYLPTVPDLSNIFCETDKYMRVSGLEQIGVEGKRMKQIFKENKKKIEKFEFPVKWGVKSI